MNHCAHLISFYNVYFLNSSVVFFPTFVVPSGLRSNYDGPFCFSTISAICKALFIFNCKKRYRNIKYYYYYIRLYNIFSFIFLAPNLFLKDIFNVIYTLFQLTNRMWFSVVCTLIDNDTRHHSGQNVVDAHTIEAHNKF